LNSPVIQNKGLTAYILMHNPSKKKVIKEMPWIWGLKNLMQQLNLYNHNGYPITFQVIGTVTHKMRVKEKNEEVEGER
jgi:hypothetical protein